MELLSTGWNADQFLLGVKTCQGCGSQVKLEPGDFWHESNQLFETVFSWSCCVCSFRNEISIQRQ